MVRSNFFKFVLNEDITVGGKPMKSDDDEKEPDYTGGGDAPKTDDKPAEDPPAETPPADGTGEEETPDYSASANPDETKPEEDPGTEPTNDTETPPSDDTTTDGGETPPTDDGAGDEETPDYSAGANGGDDANTTPEEDPATAEPPADGETPDAGIDDGSGEEETPDYSAGANGGDTADTNTTPEDNPDGGGDNPDGETPTDDGSGEGDGTGDEDNPDYSADANPGDDDGTGDVGDGTEGDTDSLDGSITQLQTDVFANMTPGQISIKIKELKSQYVTLFSDINGVIERLSQITRKENNIDTLQFVSKKFLELKDMVRDCLVYTFDDKSYVQNQVTLQELFAIYVNLVTIIEELGKGQDKK